MSGPDIGDQAPTLTLLRDGGTTLSFAELRGKKIVLFFYPKDDTPGCTKEAIGFTDKLDAFAALNTVVVGVSKDSVRKHDKFVAKHDLKIALLSDEEGQLCEEYGVWVEKKMYGKTYMGIERATYLIDEQGKITHIWRKVKVADHVETVLTTVKDMQ